MRLSSSFFVLAIWVLAAVFYLGTIILQVYPSVMIKTLTGVFHIDAGTVGFIDSLYFYVYALMQLPAGLLLDRFGAAKTLSIAFCISGLAAVIYGLAPHPWVLGSARVLAGFGTSFAFVGVAYITSRLFLRKYFTLLMG